LNGWPLWPAASGSKSDYDMTSSRAKVRIRPIEDGDQAAWRQLWTAYLSFYESTVPDDVYHHTFARLIGDDSQDFSGMIADLDGRAVGLAHFLFHRHCWKVKDVCYLQDLFVEPGVRGLGVGHALIQSVYDAADAAGARDVYWLTQENNTTARKLYDRMGRVTPFIKYSR